jgi:hypothetical protein
MNKTLKAKRAELEGAPIYYVCPNCSQWLATEDEQGATVLHPQIVPSGDSFVFPAVAQGYLKTVEGQAKLAELELKMNQASEAGEWVVAKNIKQTIKIFSDPAFPRPDWRPISIAQAVKVVCQCGALALVTPKIKGKKAPPRLTAPSALALLAELPSSFNNSEFNRALMLKDWETNQNDGSKYKETKSGTVKWQPPEIEEWFQEQQEKALNALDNRFAAIKSELTGDAIDILFHHWKTFPYPKKRDKAHITLSQICEYRGVKPTGNNLKNVWQAVRDIRGFSINSKGISERIVEMSTAQLPLFGEESTPEASTILIYSPGFFLAEAIEGSPEYLAPYLQKVWRLDPYRQSMAKRLARHLRSEWRRNTQFYINSDSSPASRRNRFSTWAKILDAAGVDVQEYLDSNNPSRLIDEVDKALETLKSIDYIEDDGPKIYEDATAFQNLPQRQGRVAAWLALRVHITPPKLIRYSLKEKNGKRIARIEKQAAQKLPLKQKKPLES